MGHYTYFNINGYHWSFKYHVPYFLLFIFDEYDFIKEAEKENGRNWFSFLGYKTTANKCIERLENFGFTQDFLVKVIKEIQGESSEYLEEKIEERARSILGKKASLKKINQTKLKLIKLTNRPKNIGTFNFKEKHNQLTTFAEFLKFLSTDNGNQSFRSILEENNFHYPFSFRDVTQPELVNLTMRNVFPTDKGSDKINLEELSTIIVNLPDIFGKDLFRMAETVEMLEIDDYLNIINLVFLKILLLSVSPRTSVKVDLSDIIAMYDIDIKEAIKSAKTMKEWVYQDITAKLNLYNRTYSILLDKGSQKELLFSKQILRNSYYQLHHESINNRGIAFEDFLGRMFSFTDELEIVDKRVNLKDQEIDLIFQNNIKQPYFQSYQTPHIFIEAKFTKKETTASTVRNFRAKIEDHKHACKLGFLISVNGFTSNAKEALKRSSHDLTIILIDNKMLEDYLNNELSLIDWLRHVVSKGAIL
ncbi:MAG: hypothetical protein HW396_1366 [Candidatus Dadabacteria bacterium]|nr:hypothetical protein [Candidatus Dadabacteria bacterium]